MLTAAPKLKRKSRVCVKCGRDYVGAQTVCLDCSGPVVPLLDEAAPAAGRILAGKYLLLEALGEGGMASVFRAKQKNLGRIVAVKLLRLVGTDRAASLRRFYAEARHTSRLAHPHNVKVFDFGHTEDGLLFIVMELVDGVPLSALDLPLDLVRALRILDQVCGALAEAHGLGLVHRDLKPDNVMLSQVDGRDFARVLDYGVAKSDQSPVLTDEGAVVGTPLYMSPEQVSSEPVDERSDVYALGAMLFELVTGRPPFQSDDYLTVVYQHKHESPPPPRRFRDMPRRLERLILDCLAKARAKRPANVGVLRERVLDLLEELGGTTSGERPVTRSTGPRLTVDETAPGRTPVPGPPPSRRRRGRLAAVVGALGLIGALLLLPLLVDPEAEGRAQTPGGEEITLVEPAVEPTEPPVETPTAPAQSSDPAAEALLSTLVAVGREARATLGGAIALAVEASASAASQAPLVAPEPEVPAAAEPPRESSRRDRGTRRAPREPDPVEAPAVEAPNPEPTDTEPSATDRLRSLTGDLLRNPPPPESPVPTE